MPLLFSAIDAKYVVEMEVHMKNKYEIRGDKVAIFIDRRDGVKLETMIDLTDLEKAKTIDGKWYAGTKKTIDSYYVFGHITINNKRKFVWLHRYLLDAPEGFHVDHINHETLNNTRENLRITTPAENHQNRLGAKKDSKSGIRGVYFHKGRKKWAAQIRTKEVKFLQYFNTIDEAAKAANEAREKFMPFSQEAMNQKRF
jgi:hypothetical protein